MRLTDLEPQWLEKDGRRIGLIFLCPVKRVRSDGRENPTPWRMTCFFSPTPHGDQYDAIVAAVGEEARQWTQGCKESFGWTCTPELEVATFDNITITPSIDGGDRSWHGWIKNGEVT